MLKYVVLLALFSCAFSQTITPLSFVPCDSSSTCIYQTNVAGTVLPGEWVYYSVDLDSVDFSTSGDNTTELDFYLYLSAYQTNNIGLDFVVGTDSLPTTSKNEYEASCYENCYSTYSHSECSPSKTTWYIGVYNQGNTIIPFDVSVYYGSTDGWCDALENLGKFILILVLCIFGGIVLCGVLILGVLCMCCGLTCAVCCPSKKTGYVQIQTPAQPATTVVTLQPPGPYPPTTPYPGPIQGQTQFPAYNSALGIPNSNPYYYSNQLPNQQPFNQV